MKKLALVQLQLEKTDQYVFQRRDGSAPTSPRLLAFFGGHAGQGEPAKKAAVRELTEETSLDVRGLAIAHVVSLELPFELHSEAESIELHLFSASIPDAGFAVYEGTGCEIYNREVVLRRNDVAVTARYLLERVP